MANTAKTVSPAMTAVKNLCYLQGLLKVTDEVLASKMGISRATWFNRKNRPQLLTLRELEMVCGFFAKKGYEISPAQLMVPMVPGGVDPAGVA